METLFGTQQQAAQEVLQTLESAPKGSVIFLQGLRGTGKSLVVDSILNDIADREACVDEHLESHMDYRADADDIRRKLQEGKVVSFGSLWERHLLEESLQKKFPENKLYTCTLKGLALSESLSLVRTMRAGKPIAGLSDEALAELSLGIPLLISQLTVDSGVTIAIAQQIAGQHLGRDLLPVFGRKNLHEGMNQFLQITPNPKIVDIAANADFGRNKDLYSHLPYVYAEMRKLQDEGLTEESPLFIAGESVRIYNEMLKKGDFAPSAIDIFAPEMSGEDIERAAQAMGFLEDLDSLRSFTQVDSHYAENSATRVRMFGKMYAFGYRKTAIWLRTPKGRELFGESEGRGIREQAAKAETDFIDGKLPLKTNKPFFTGRLYFHRHGHRGETFMPASAGWIVESMLQQRGISYLVNNVTLGKTYVYNSETQAIEYTPFDISRR